MGRSAGGGVGRKARLADESFLKDLSADELRQMYKEEKDPRNRQKLQVAYHYKSGKTVAAAAEAACTEYENARRWIADMRRRGRAAIPHRKSPGRLRKLTRAQYRILVLDVHKGPRKCGYKTNTWSFALVYRHAKKKFKVDMAYSTFVHNMHELGLVVKSPRTSHPDEATPEERAEFQRETRKKLLKYARKGHLVLFLDEAFLQSYKNAQRTVGIKGDKTTVPTSVERALLPLMGVLGDGFYYFMEIDRANTATLKRFTSRAIELFGPIQYIKDHAKYHKSDSFEEYAEANWRYLERHFTRPYTPNDNSIEGQWKKAKEAISNVSLRSRNHMSETLGDAVRAGEVQPVDIFEYAKVRSRRLSPREARAIKSKIGKGEHFYYVQTDPPGRIRLPTADELRTKREEAIAPEMLDKIPAILLKSDLPVKYLANLPKLLQKK